MCRVFLIGDSLFTEAIAQMLAEEGQVKVVGTAVYASLDSTAVARACPHVIIVADTRQHQGLSAALLSDFPDVPLINADLNQDYVQIITSRRVSARRTDLLAAIYELSKPTGD